MEQIAEWLEKLGLEQYAKLFANNDIDVSVLPHLSDHDLKDLGVSLGHRRKIFAAINKGFSSVQPLAEAERPEEPKALTTQIVSLAEQRPMLMIFEDIHWIDPTSLEALGRGIDRIKSVGVLLIITSQRFRVSRAG